MYDMFIRSVQLNTCGIMFLKIFNMCLMHYLKTCLVLLVFLLLSRLDKQCAIHVTCPYIIYICFIRSHRTVASQLLS